MDNSKLKRNIRPFDGDKYSVWKLRIRNLLNELEVIKVIDNVVPETPDSEWLKNERVAKNTLIEYLSDSLLGLVADKSAKEIFKTLDNIYERKSIATQLALRKKLLNLKLKGDMSLLKHFQLFDELMVELMAAGANLEEADKVTHLFMTLPNEYDGVITAIETLTEDNLTLGFTKTRLLDHEIKLINERRDTSMKVLQAEITNQDNTKQRNPYKYSNSNRPHKNFRIKKDQYKHIKCHCCGRKGHLQKNCFYNKLKNKNSQHKWNKNNRTIQTVNITDREKPTTSGFAFMAGAHKSEQRDPNYVSFILDSGASDHFINRDDLAQDFELLENPINISVAKNGTYIRATKKGNLAVKSDLCVEGTLQDVLFCPEMPYNLLSVKKMQLAGMTVVFNNDGTVEIINQGKLVTKGESLANNLIGVNFLLNKCALNTDSSLNRDVKDNYELWHQRLGHIGKAKFAEIKSKQMFSDTELLNKVIINDKLCEDCIKGKQSRLPFNNSKSKIIKRPLFNVHSDVCGPITPTTLDNKNYFVIFVDEYTHYAVTYLIAHKSDVFAAFQDYVAKSEAHFNLRLVNLYCDNGGEYLSNEMKQYCVQKGISYHLTVPHTPALNGIAERMIRTITERSRAMVSGAKLSKTFWGEAVLTVTYLINISPTKALKTNNTPFELWHSKMPSLKYLKVFGSTVYFLNNSRKTKFDDKSSKGILVGYEPNGYKVWDVVDEKFVKVRDVIVDEINFLSSRPLKPDGIISDNYRKSDEQSCKKMCTKSDSMKSDVNKQTGRVSAPLGPPPNKSVSETDGQADCGSFESKLTESQNELVSENNPIRKSQRIKNMPKISYNETEDDISVNYLLYAKSLICKIPYCYKEIESRDDKHLWENAIKEELNSLIENETWTLVQKPVDRNIVDCKWIFTIKNDEFGKPMKYKARLVARGFSQEYLIDYNETFAPVARITSFRFILAFANQFNLLVHHMDVKTAFLNGKLEEEIFMKIPEGIPCAENQVCKLNKSLYGLKQSARCWFLMFEQALIERGFRYSSADRCIYILDAGDIMKNIYVVLYVDDLVISTADINTMNNFKRYLMNKFKMVDLKEIRCFLGIRIQRTKNIITLDQELYIKTVLEKFNMSDCNPVSTPLECQVDYTELNSCETTEVPCRNLIGCLMYIMVCTRPDLSFSINLLSRFTNKNNRKLWSYLKRVLRYLKGSMNFKLTYTRNSYDNFLCGFVDSSWGDNELDRKSTTGYVFKLFEQCTLCWQTKRQQTVAASTTEAEYMALFEAVRESLWLKSLVTSINVQVTRPIPIYEDNNGCISIANNPTSHKRSKHIDIKYHFSREQVENNIIKLIYVSTGNQLADILTKPLPTVRFSALREKLGVKQNNM